MIIDAFPTAQIRQSLNELPETMAADTAEPNPYALYVVMGHERALDPDSTLVVGDRGTGKSFWGAALNSPVSRALIHAQLPRLHLDRVQTSWGFSVSTSNQDHPSRRVLQRLQNRFAPEDIWRAVVLRQLSCRYEVARPIETWEETVAWVATNPEHEERLLEKISNRLMTEGKRHLVVFDAIDRIGSDWKAIRALARGLLQVCLDLKGQPGIQTKVFLRPDLWEDRVIWQFPDSSKLHHSRVILEWHRTDLYGLLWHWLCNHGESAKHYRDWLSKQHRLSFRAIDVGGKPVYPLPTKLRHDEDLQQAVLHDMATRYMGTNRRRGRTYTWLPNHLADAKGQVSPRSFLIAVRDAQRETLSRGHAQVLHWDGIKRGVQSASSIRVEELREDYPWIRTVLAPLSGQNVPCKSEEIERRWREAETVQAIKRDQEAIFSPEPFGNGTLDDEPFYLLPHALDSASSEVPEQELIHEMQGIGVIRRMDDEKVDIPDLFRVAAAIGRCGGVRPVR